MPSEMNKKGILFQKSLFNSSVTQSIINPFLGNARKTSVTVICDAFTVFILIEPPPTNRAPGDVQNIVIDKSIILCFVHKMAEKFYIKKYSPMGLY